VVAARRTVRQAPPKPVNSDNLEVNDLQRQVAEMQRQFDPFAQGAMLEWKNNMGFIKFKHGLGRTPVGIINIGCHIKDTDPPPSIAFGDADSASITVRVDSVCDGRVWVY